MIEESILKSVDDTYDYYRRQLFNSAETARALTLCACVRALEESVIGESSRIGDKIGKLGDKTETTLLELSRQLANMQV